jgi:hypothetical protein
MSISDLSVEPGADKYRQPEIDSSWRAQRGVLIQQAGESIS